MTRKIVKIVRATLLGAWIALVVGVVALTMSSRLAPGTGRHVFVIRGSSMVPTIPLGSLVLVREADPSEIKPGQIVTVRYANGVVVTHRVLSISDPDGSPLMIMKGDGNATADPNPVPVSAALGYVEAYAPGLGFLMALLSAPSGIVSVVSFAMTLLLARSLAGSIVTDPAPTARTIRPARTAAV